MQNHSVIFMLILDNTKTIVWLMVLGLHIGYTNKCWYKTPKKQWATECSDTMKGFWIDRKGNETLV